MSVQVSYKKQTLLGIIGITILLLVIEIIANVWWSTQINCEFEDNELFASLNDEKKRQLCIDLYEIRTSGKEIIPNQVSNTININNHGFRGDDFSVMKESGTYRIIMLGGSTMFGTGATSDFTTIPGYLQNMFEKNNSGINIEVINAGIQGADSISELNLIQNKLLQFSPDMIIIYDGWNDLRANHDSKQLLKNWNSVCDIGEKNNFDVVISLQPLAGFGKKILTNQESEYMENGVDYSNKPLINLLPTYEEYQKNLSKLNNCESSINLRNVFDEEIQPIYWDQGHVSDSGNEIIAKSFYKNLFIPITKKYNSEDFDTTVQNIENNESVKTENIVRDIISNYKTSIMLTELFSLNNFNKIPSDSSVQDQLIFETNSMLYDNREINIIIELMPPNFIESENKMIKIFTYDTTNQTELENVTYFLSIYNQNKNLFREYFYVQDKFLIFKINPTNSESIIITGEKQYDHNAYIMNDDSLLITGPIFLSSGDYEFHIDLRTIDEASNWIFSLDGFEAKISIKN